MHLNLLQHLIFLIRHGINENTYQFELIFRDFLLFICKFTRIVDLSGINMQLKKLLASCGNLPKRHILVLLCFIGLLCVFGVRICISIAIVKIVSTSNETSSDVTFDWNQETQGAILSSFYIGYTISLFFGGYLAERFGGKWTLSLGILLSAITSILTPPLVEIGGATALILLRITNGLGQGTMFPALGMLIANWIPKEERSFVGSIVMGAGQLGSVIGYLLSAFLLEKFSGWSLVFYVYGTCSVLWFFAFIFSCYNDPNSHPTLSEEEKKIIEKSLGQLERKHNSNVPWREMWTSIPFLTLLVAQIGHDWGFYMMGVNLSKYLNDVLNVSIQTNGFISSVAYLLMWIFSLIVGYVSDLLIRLNYMKITNVRKTFATISSTGFGFFILLASYIGLNQALAITFILIAHALMGAFFPSIRVNAIDLTPNYAGTLIAISNGLGSITGFVGSYTAGVLTPNASLEEWRVVFWISFVIFSVSSLIYCIWGSAEQQTWNRQEDEIKQKNSDKDTKPVG